MTSSLGERVAASLGLQAADFVVIRHGVVQHGADDRNIRRVLERLTFHDRL